MDPALADRLGALVRASDPDRYFATLFAPQEARPLLFALYAFNAELARIGESVREPMLGAIRLAWWREAAESASDGHPRNHDVAKGLAHLFAQQRIALCDLETLMQARACDSALESFANQQELETYIDATSGQLMRLAARILGHPHAQSRNAARAYGLTGLLRSLDFHSRRHKLYLPLDLLSSLGLEREDFFHLAKDDAKLRQVIAKMGSIARDYFEAACACPKPGGAMPAILPAALVPVYLRNLLSERDVPIYRRQIALLLAAIRARL